jgi:hypothetical protein
VVNLYSVDMMEGQILKQFGRIKKRQRCGLGISDPVHEAFFDLGLATRSGLAIGIVSGR